jgi:anti-sigma factor RsiW
LLREMLEPIAEEPIPAQLNLGRMIEARRKPPATAWRSAAAAVLLLVGGASGWFGHAALQAPSGGIAALAREASDTYAVYSADRVRPVEIRASDSADLVRWVSNRIQRPVMVPNLAGSGYRFMGGRLVATQHGPAGMFMYDDDKGTRLVMLMRPMAVEQDAAPSRYEKDGITSLAWAVGGMGYSLVGAAPFATLLPILDDIRKQAAQGG